MFISIVLDDTITFSVVDILYRISGKQMSDLQNRLEALREATQLYTEASLEVVKDKFNQGKRKVKEFIHKDDAPGPYAYSWNDEAVIIIDANHNSHVYQSHTLEYKFLTDILERNIRIVMANSKPKTVSFDTDKKDRA